MPSKDRKDALSLDAARARLAAESFPDDTGDAGERAVGLEPESFAIRVDDHGRPQGRLALDGPGSVLEIMDQLAASDDTFLPRDPTNPAPQIELVRGGRLTFEPGGQIEHSTAPHSTVGAALNDVDDVADRLAAALDAQGARLVALGRDMWFGADDVPQQLSAPRYVAMAGFFEKHGQHGRTMMRLSTSCQVNLELGHGDERTERWELANLISPLLTALFASSPTDDGAVSGRALAWQELDPTRTGFPPGFAEGPIDPARQWGDAALDADVMMFRESDGGMRIGEPGFRFRDWIESGHPEFGWPTEDDLVYHLTTLFFEVRPRRFFEFRAADSLPGPWRQVPAVFLVGLFYDAEMRRSALELCRTLRDDLDGHWQRAARAGVRDETLGALAIETFKLALQGARRLAADFRPGDIECAERYFERFTSLRRSPADEVAEWHAKGREFSLAWAEVTRSAEVPAMGTGCSSR